MRYWPGHTPGGGGWEVGNIFNMLIKHVFFLILLFQVGGPWQSTGHQVASAASCGLSPHEWALGLMSPRIGVGGVGASHDKQNIYNQVWR